MQPNGSSPLRNLQIIILDFLKSEHLHATYTVSSILLTYPVIIMMNCLRIFNIILNICIYTRCIYGILSSTFYCILTFMQFYLFKKNTLFYLSVLYSLPLPKIPSFSVIQSWHAYGHFHLNRGSKRAYQRLKNSYPLQKKCFFEA